MAASPQRRRNAATHFYPTKIQFGLPQEMADDLGRLAAQRTQSIASLIRYFIGEGLRAERERVRSR